MKRHSYLAGVISHEKPRNDLIMSVLSQDLEYTFNDESYHTP